MAEEHVGRPEAIGRAEDNIDREAIGHAEECSKEALKEDEIEIARAEMSQVREENARLKMLLEKIEDDYTSLQMRFTGICQTKKSSNDLEVSDKIADSSSKFDQEPELVSLCLGRSSSPGEPKKQQPEQKQHHLQKEDDLKLGLHFHPLVEDSKSDIMKEKKDSLSPENSQVEEEEEEEEGRETWSPNKALKVARSGADDDLSQTGTKKTRVSVRARCETPTMNDGCQWRKYGQKIAKGNPCPRAYYRCTVAPLCPVRKQVQRCAEDTSILITTYEGTHNHPLPFSATAMASTTSAAASMLLSGSSSSSKFASNGTLNRNLIGLNVNLADNTRSQPYYLPNPSQTSHPTITLDLTKGPSTTSNQFNISSSTSFQSIPRLNTSNLSFLQSQPSLLSSIWGNGNLSDGANVMAYSKNQMMGSSQPGKISQEHTYQVPFLQKSNYQAAAVPSQQALTESLTKAITSDPNFRSVVAAAITTMVAKGSGTAGASGVTQASNDKYEGLGKIMKWDDKTTVGVNGKDCSVASFLNHSPFAAQRSASLRKQQSQPPFSISKVAASATPSENVDQTNRILLE